MEYDFLIVLGVLLLAVFVAVYVFVKSRSTKISSGDLKFIKDKWCKVVNHLEISPNEAVLEADKLLGYVLGLKGYEGSVGEQLKKASGLISNPDNVWNAHKLRNRVAHEIGLSLKPKEARRAIKHFKSAIKDLGAKL